MTRLLVLSLLCAPSTVRVYERGGEAVSVTLSDVKEARLFDPQYGETRRYLGASLAEVKGVTLEAGDTALLRFINGMIIPVPRADLGEVFIATAVEIDGVMSARFPIISRKNGIFVDNRPTVFSGNKVIFSKDKRTGFSPWHHADTLSEVEWVNGAAYLEQFRVSEDATPGWRVFAARCQFCHSVKSVGSSFGWDFVQPVKLYTYRSRRGLSDHVKYRENDAPQKGVMMPALTDTEQREVDSLWVFMREVAERPLKAYVPAHDAK